MDATVGAGSISVGGGWSQVYGTGGAGMLSAEGADGAAAGGAITASQSVLSLSSTSVTASSESFMATSGGAASNNEQLGAVLLMLILEYLKSNDPTEKKDLVSLISALAQQQGQGNGGGETLMYSSSSLSIESTQLQAASTDVAISAYNGGSATLQQTPGADPGAAGLNVIA